MLKILNAVALTLLVALASVVPAAMVGPYLPEIFNGDLQQIAIAAWVAALITWWTARMFFRKEQEATREAIEKSSSSGHPKAAIMTLGFVALAVGVLVAYRFFGDGLLG